ncbi:MAE_28990/MAE_18760 family HEPN-like nuclease [Cobetia amphilecti]|uniref:MAE_28990/MAE_18760 family HEPN-like nuclease n=1 Tax=Cobetia amphilecti TaxID=1055104 RepID=UPI0026E25A79|nr:MAE_28990/MAE_18760 family HEPN-like nuclease [Cobetia amphilecti]MDO6814269.1 MAE_28990/MAE_18760 family HEPN-like nuclease [Cobetia amphilecti]
MTLETTRTLSTERFNEVRIFLGYLIEQEPNEPAIPDSPEFKIQKGLFYVQLYSALEKTINDAVEKALLYIAEKSILASHYSESFYAVVLKDKLKSFKDSGYKKFFDGAVSIFAETRSQNTVKIDETIFANSLQNVWAKSIKTIFIVFGKYDFQLDRSSELAIDEVVNKRNAVAHGRESALTVGESHTVSTLQDRYNTIRQVCISVIDELEDFCSSQVYIKPEARSNYN